MIFINLEELNFGSQEIPLTFLTEKMINRDVESGSDEDSASESKSDEPEDSGKIIKTTPEPEIDSDELGTGTCPLETSPPTAVERNIPVIIITKFEGSDSSESTSSEGVDMIISPFLALPENPNLKQINFEDIYKEDSGEDFFNLIDSNDLQVQENQRKNQEKSIKDSIQERYSKFVDLLFSAFSSN